MNVPEKEVLKYRFKKAAEALEEASAMANMEHWSTCINRLYYAAFYAVTALLFQHHLSSSKHTGVRAFFNKNFIATGRIPKEYGELYNLLFNYRHQSAYEDFFSIDPAIVKDWIAQTQRFIVFLEQSVHVENPPDLLPSEIEVSVDASE